VVDYLMGPASFLKFTTSVAHYIVDDSDHVLMRMTIPGHLVKRKSKTKTTVSWRLDLLKDKQIADTYRAQIKDLSHVVMRWMSTKTSTSTRWTRCSSRSQMSYARQQAFRSVARSGGDAAWWTQEYAVIRSETQEAYEVAMHSKLASDWELCDASRRTKR
jgi:hypothetical protein